MTRSRSSRTGASCGRGRSPTSSRRGGPTSCGWVATDAAGRLPDDLEPVDAGRGLYRFGSADLTQLNERLAAARSRGLPDRLRRARGGRPGRGVSRGAAGGRRNEGGGGACDPGRHVARGRVELGDPHRRPGGRRGPLLLPDQRPTWTRARGSSRGAAASRSPRRSPPTPEGQQLLVRTVLGRWFSWFLFPGTLIVGIYLSVQWVPGTYTRRTIDRYVSRPIGRTAFLLVRQASALSIVAAGNAALVAGIFLIVVVKTGVYPWAFLVAGTVLPDAGVHGGLRLHDVGGRPSLESPAVCGIVGFFAALLGWFNNRPSSHDGMGPGAVTRWLLDLVEWGIPRISWVRALGKTTIAGIADPQWYYPRRRDAGVDRRPLYPVDIGVPAAGLLTRIARAGRSSRVPAKAGVSRGAPADRRCASPGVKAPRSPGPPGTSSAASGSPTRSGGFARA